MCQQLPLSPGQSWQESREAKPAPSAAIKYSLSALKVDYHFFNHGVLFTHAGMRFPEEDPLNDWYAKQPRGTPLIKELFQSQIFEGLHGFAGGTTWDHVICAVRHADWQDLWAFLCSTALIDRARERYVEVFSGDVDTLDPVLVERFTLLYDKALQFVPVTVFCLNGNDQRWEILRPDTKYGKPVLVSRPPEQRVLDTAAYVLRGDASKLADKSNQALDALFHEAVNANRIQIPGTS